jgi:hypothetical protein
MDKQGVSMVNPVAINARAEALEKAEADEAAKGPAAGGDDAAAKAAADKAAAEKAEADKKAAEDAAKSGKGTEDKGGTEDKFVKSSKKAPNDPDELRKWNTRVAQENKKLRDEMIALKEAQEKTFKLLSSISKKPVDYKELAKDPEKLQKFIEEERANATAELQERLDQLTSEAKAKDTTVERMRREQDVENYPEWKRLYPHIVKIAMGPTGQGDPRVDFTKPAAEVLDSLYELALAENPALVVTPEPTEKVYKESEMKSMLADMVAKEKEAIAKTAKEEAIREAREALAEEIKGGTVASAGKGAGRVPSDQLVAFKKMSLNEQREWLIAQQANA